MPKFKAIAVNEPEHEFRAATLEHARHWVINHLDTSKIWSVVEVTEEGNMKTYLVVYRKEYRHKIHTTKYLAMISTVYAFNDSGLILATTKGIWDMKSKLDLLGYTDFEVLPSFKKVIYATPPTT